MYNAPTVNNKVPDEGIAVQQSERLRGNFTKSFQKDFADSLPGEAGVCVFISVKEEPCCVLV